MFRINDYVVYKTTGVCRIVDISKEIIGDNEIEYFVLQPAYNNNLTIKIPVNNSEAMMREIITKDDALSLISSMPEKETIWVDDGRRRSEVLKAALRSGEIEEWVKIIKTLYLEKQEKTDIGKKLMKMDEDILKAAEKNLHEEFAIVLDISPDEVASFILNHVS